MRNLTKNERSWVLYDWANSVHSTIISTAIFPLWFGQVAAKGGLSETQTTFWLGSANTGYAIIIALIAGILGTISDIKGMRRRLFIPFWVLGFLSTGALVLVGVDAWILALVLYVFSFLGFSGANIFYDASLPDVTTPARIDMVSSMGFGYGYIGGSTIPFLLSLGILALLSGMDFSQGLPDLGVKISFALAALWWMVFTFPYIKNIRQKGGIDPAPSPIAESFRRLGHTFREIRKHKKVFLFLMAYFLYIDGVNTIIKMATNFAASIGVGMIALLGTIIGIQILAFPFTLLYGKLADRWGSRQMIFVGIAVYGIITGLGMIMPFVPVSAVIPVFLTVGFLVATSQGGIQALSRSYYASIIPNQDDSGKFFGFYNIVGRFATILGPLLMGGLPRLAYLLGIASERKAYSFGVGALLLLFISGWCILASLDKQRSHPS